jgi:hypothetical protein
MQEAHGQIINNPHLFSWGLSASLFLFFFFFLKCLFGMSFDEGAKSSCSGVKVTINNLPPYNFTKDR